MIAMQYSIPLPADYDMERIRQRVAAKGGSFDGLEGLALKAFLVSLRGRHGAAENAYAPFYVWRTAAGVAEFLCGARFRAVVDAFGCPVVRTWVPLAFDHHRERTPRAATRELVALAPGDDLERLRREEEAAHARALGAPGVVARAVALDPQRWELVRFTLWSDAPEAVAARGRTAYEVLHVSSASP